ncbi:DNA topoisomerase II [Naegleria gruberi]|uniref:DNA topoisomerase 2 n=1 Tax=Naegleria gruberi TaxID=5762 RepID=D2UZM0_NAEGR|nr:DNA topoisomerase II [Naegleria gruberi]EFC50179.1 DNA topoisomerase II [Naegleria gruberi]|eukprot:XP_002682923.1 DNA topoisomerase II [Naegleria gruberi strain NEG-M]
MPPKKKAPAAAPKRKRKEESDDEASAAEESDDEVEFIDHDESNNNKNKTVEEIYQKKSLREQILLRPDTYVGSVNMQEGEDMWIWDDEDKRMKMKTIKFVPALYKIFDEILVNAADHSVRDETCNKIKVTINPEQNEISVYNNGAGIPVKIHAEHKIYVPTMIFGHLLTSSNFDDTQKRVTGGRNGYGAKLTNIFSEKFIVETVDSEEKKKFRQTWTQNMEKEEEPKITTCSKAESYTEITFYPDLSKFGMDKLDDDIVSLLKKRVYDLAGTLKTGIGIYLNGKKITGMKTFKDYVKLYTIDKEIHYFEDGKRWKVGITLSEGSMQQVSFVNSICTTKGGKHVDHIVNQVSDNIKKALVKKNNTIKPAYIKNQLWVFVSSLIINPSFDSQSKETLTTSMKDFGSKCKLDEAFLKKVTKMASEAVLKYADFKSEKALNKKSGTKKSRLTGISKLDDANDAGSKNSEKCTLILTEGDSAKALAVGGLSVVGRDYYGVFPLKGKPLNVRDCKLDKVVKNEEISTLAKILGLKFDKTYTKEDIKSLRYGSIMIMADQDHDGSHIKGLLINFIHKFWPSLLKIPGFLKEFITPIVKATNNRTKKAVTFFSIPEYETWKEGLSDTKGWTIKYYKGLGTSTAPEAKEYFSNMSLHQKRFKYDTDCDKKITSVFSKAATDERKEWLNNHQEGTYIDHSKKEISYTDFIDKELILFSKADCKRSIPSIVDGLKPGQRKILFSCFKRNLKKEIKVAQLAGYVSEQSAYHHGEDSLNGTVVNMAQNFVGSNNINLLYPGGMFGTRLQGGKDSASPRYIFTKLSEITRYIFPKADDPVLEYLDDDGQSIEPRFYVPILPMVLVNGSEGIGTAWSTNIETYNPVDIVEGLKALIKGEEAKEFHPWYKGFDGIIERLAPTKWQTKGVIEKIDDNTLDISELPIRIWTESFKERLEKMMEAQQVDDFRENHTDVTVSFTVKMTDKQMKDAEDAGLYDYFKLFKKFSTSNMVLFSEEGGIKEYETVLDILKEFYPIRLKFYGKRKEYMLEKMKKELEILSNKVRFIMEVINETIQVKKRKKADLLKELKTKKYSSFPKEKKIAAAGDIQNEEEEEEEDEEKDVADLTDGYNYLLSMPLWSLTVEKVKKLEKEKEEKVKEVEQLENTKPETMWLSELDEFLEKLDSYEQKEQKEFDFYLKKIEKERGKHGKIPRPKGYRATSKLRPDIVVNESTAKVKTTRKRATSVKKEEQADDDEKPKRGRKPAVKKEEDEDDAEEKEEKPKRGRKPAAKKVVKEESDEEEDEEKEEKPKRGRKPAAKKKDDKDDEKPKRGRKPATKKQRVKRKTSAATTPAQPAASSSQSDEKQEDEELITAPIKTRETKPPTKKRKTSITDFFELKKKAEEVVVSDAEEDKEEPKARGRPVRTTRANKKVESEDEEEEEEEIIELSDSEASEPEDGEDDGDEFIPSDEED